MTTKHTPGPWTVVTTNVGTHIRHEEDGYFLTLLPMCRGLDNLQANARLIAAAPDLLAALEMVREWVDSGYEAHDPCAVQEHVLAALAKARPEAS